MFSANVAFSLARNIDRYKYPVEELAPRCAITNAQSDRTFHNSKGYESVDRLVLSNSKTSIFGFWVVITAKYSVGILNG